MLTFLVVVVVAVVVIAIIGIAIGGGLGIVGGVAKVGVDGAMKKARSQDVRADDWSGEPIVVELAPVPGVENVRRKVLDGADARTVECKMNRGFGKRVNAVVGGFTVGQLKPANTEHAAAIDGIRQQGIKRARTDIGLDNGVPKAVLVLGS